MSRGFVLTFFGMPVESEYSIFLSTRLFSRIYLQANGNLCIKRVVAFIIVSEILAQEKTLKAKIKFT